MDHKLQLIIISSIINFMFFTSGIDKVLHFSKVVEGLKKRFPFELPFIFYNLMISIAILIELIAPIIIVFGIIHPTYKKYGVYACYSLIVFTVLATLMYHFPPKGNQWYPFTSNITTVGGLLALSVLLFHKMK